MTTWTEAQIDRHLHLWEHRHGPDSPEAGIVRQLRAERDKAGGTTDHDLYYLRCIGRRLAEFQEALDGIDALTIGGDAMADERDWLDDYLHRQTAALSTTQETPHD